MKLLSLQLKNFRQFYGEQEIEFSVDDDRNVTLIHAENGSGKTALLNSILWCLYEKTTPNFEQPRQILNYRAREEGDNLCHVNLKFEEEGVIYYAHRAKKGSTVSFKVLIEDFTGVKPITQDPGLFINSILPKDMAEYFFFQGEGFGSMSTAEGGERVKQAVRSILGFNIAEAAIKDLRRLKTEYARAAARSDTNEERSRIQNQLLKYDDDYAKNLNTINDLSSSIVLFEERIKQIDKELSDSNSAVVREQQMRRLALEKSIRSDTSDLKKAILKKSQLIRTYGTNIFMFAAKNKSLDFINDLELEGRLPAPYNTTLVNDILNTASCICGAPIHEGSEAFINIHKLLEKAADPEHHGRVVAARAKLVDLTERYTLAKDELLSNFHTIAELESRISSKGTELAAITLAMRDVDPERIGSLESQRQDFVARTGAANRQIGSLEAKNREILDLKKQGQDFINNSSSQIAEYNKNKRLESVVDDIENVISSTLDNSEKNIDVVIISKINSFLKKYLRENYVAKISSRFEVSLFDENDTQVAHSDGQGLLLSLTFISSLIELARDRKNVKNAILTSGAIAPFVIDAPFGELDNTYKGSVAKNIPESVNQVVFLLSSSHWEGQVDENIRHRVGKEYNLVVESSSEQGDKEISSISVRDKLLPSIRYGMPVDCTRIEEVI